MPQPGVHAILAVAARRTFSTRRWFPIGLVLGSLIPDADTYAQAYGVLVQSMDAHTAEVVYHRTLTHSLFFAFGLVLILYLVSFVRGGRALRAFGAGLGVGMTLFHILPDILAWFDAVGVLWPLWSVNLWGWIEPPELLIKLLRAANFWSFAGYLYYLSALARKAGTDSGYLPRLRRHTYIQSALGLVFTVLAFMLPSEVYNLPDGAAFLLFGYPNAVWVTWRMRETIEAAQPAKE